MRRVNAEKDLKTKTKFTMVFERIIKHLRSANAFEVYPTIDRRLFVGHWC